MAPAQSTRTRSGIEEGRGEWLPALRQTAGAGMAARRSADWGAGVLQAGAMVETERQGVQSATKTWPIPEETVLAVGVGVIPLPGRAWVRRPKVAQEGVGAILVGGAEPDTEPLVLLRPAEGEA